MSMMPFPHEPKGCSRLSYWKLPLGGGRAIERKGDFKVFRRVAARWLEKGTGRVTVRSRFFCRYIQFPAARSSRLDQTARPQDGTFAKLEQGR